jgi:ribosomal protein S18 acetylase RimI-like enzyme
MSITTAHGICCRDWRTCDASDAIALVQAEVRAWREALAWDVADAWSVIEPARRAGQLPGLIAYDGTGHPAGWTAYLPHDGHLQVMALDARDDVVAASLVDGLLESAEGRTCESVIFCVRDTAPGLADVLRRRHFDVDIYRYLTKDLADERPTSHAVPRWQGHDEAMAALCATAYRDSPGVRAFAPDGTRHQWRQYIATLVQGTACGWFLPELSFVVHAPAGGPAGRELSACLMLTDLGTGAAHVAQLAVAPDSRGRGLGRQLVTAAIGEASRFYDQLSLLVSGSNGPAVHLYASVGFRDHARFIVASRR